MKVFSFFSLLVITLVILLAVVVNSAATTEKQPEENANDSSEPEVPIVPTTEVANASSKETANVPSTNVPNVPSTDADPITAPRSASRPLAICDIGSNGIRFEIMSSLDQGGMHVLYKERAPISLLNAQQPKELENESIASASSSASEVQTQSRSPVSDPVLKEIDGSALKDIDGSMSRFAEIAQNYNAELRICATEASRTAPNSEALLKRIKTATGETVRLLSKAEESTLTALGVSATLWNPCGPVMDLGGGSLELNYLNNKGDPLNLNEDFGKALSIPYGAGIVQKRLDEALKPELQSDPETSPNRKVLDEVSRAIEDAKATMKLDELNTCAGKTLYLTGGGFRAIGYLAMYYLNHPFSIINGFTITASKLQEICEVYAAKSQKDLKADLKQVRSIGADRYPQISADLLVIRAALDKLKPVDVTFAEGGVPHGLALNTMPPKERQRDPLAVSADEYAQRMGSALQKGEKEAFDEKMKAAYDAEKVGSAKIPPRVVDAAIRLVHLGDSPNVKVQAGGVFHLILRAPLLGLTHQDRAMLLIILINRYGGAIDKPDNERFNKIKEVAGGEEIANGCKFIGNMLRKAAMDVITVNAFAPVVALDITPPLAAGQEQLVVSADEYAKRMGSPVTDSEKKALETWVSTAFSSQKIPSNVIQAAIRLVHLGDAASKDTRASNVFHLILRAPLLGLDSDRGDREMLLLILIHRYGGDLDVEEEGQLMEMKTKLKKGTGTNKKGTGIKKGTRIKKVVKKCKQIGKMLRLAMDVNAAGALEKKQVVLRRAEKIIEGSLEEVLEVVVKDKKAALVDVPYIKNRMENMGVELVKEF